MRMLVCFIILLCGAWDVESSDDHFTPDHTTNDGKPKESQQVSALDICKTEQIQDSNVVDEPRKAVVNCSHNNLVGSLDWKNSMSTNLSDITIMDLSWNSITSVDTETLRALKHLNILNLSHNQINVFTTPFHCLGELEVLDVSDNDISDTLLSYPTNIFTNLTKLISLTFDALPNASLPAAFQTLNSLRNLTLKGNLVLLQNETFLNLRTLPLKHLVIESCCLNYIEAGTFRHLSHLERLELHDLPHLSLYAASLSWPGLRWTSIKTLSLSRVGGLARSVSELVSVDDNFFAGLQNTNITSLELDENCITQINVDNLYRYLPRLQRLSVAYNLLVLNVPLVDRLHRHTELRYINISYQHFTTPVTGSKSQHQRCSQMIDKYSSPARFIQQPETQLFKDEGEGVEFLSSQESESVSVKYPPNLEIYDTSYAIFQTIYPAYNLSHATKLRFLGIRGSRIVRLEKQLLFVDEPENEITIDVSNNDMTEISPIFFAQTTLAEKMEGLLLRGNQLGNMFAVDGCRCIGNLRNLKTLDLSDNRIKVLPEDAFENLTVLETIILAKNSIRTFELDLTYHTLLKHLDVSNNLLPSFSWKIMDAIDSLGGEHNLSINLLGNPLVCDCHTLNFVQWIRQHNRNTNGNITFLNIDQYACLYQGQVIKWSEIDTIINKLQAQCDMSTIIITVAALVSFLFLLCSVSLIIHRHRWDIKFWLIGSVIDKKMRQEESEQERRTYLYDAFVSYHQNDIDWVKNVLLPETEDIAYDKLRLCLHNRDFIAGKVIEENIVQSIKDSRKTLLIVSRRFLTSQWCQFEVQMARMTSLDIGRDVIVPVVIEPISVILKYKAISPTMLNLLKKRTYLEWPRDPDDAVGRTIFWNRLRRALRCATVKRIRCECGRMVCPSLSATGCDTPSSGHRSDRM